MNRANGKIFKAIIVGGGASGLLTAIELSNKFGGQNVLLVEKLDRVGKKLLSTGNGQCNLTNKNCAISRFHGELPLFSESILNRFGYKSVCEYFENLGLLLTEENGKVYPLSRQASSVVDALRFKLLSLNTNVITGAKVDCATKKGDLFTACLSNGECYLAQNLIISVGGKAQKHLGTDGGSYSLLEDFGHELTKLYPSIVQLKCEPSKIKGLKGLKQKALVKTTSNGNSVEFSGDILFTDFGVSGNSVFSISSYIKGGDGEVVVDFCPDLSFEELKNSIIKKQNNCSYLTGENLMLGVMNSKIACAVLRNSGFNLNSKISSFNAGDVASALKNYKIRTLGTLGFDYAQVTKGGITTKDFSNETLESKLVKNLYATGEVLDVDGDCGGFNLTWAFSSAFAVSEAIN